jgi:hypothetical protein
MEREEFVSSYEKCLEAGIWRDMLGGLYFSTPRREAGETGGAVCVCCG